MGSFEEFYGNRENCNQSNADREFVGKYNKMIDLAIPMINQVLVYYRLHPPESYEWAMVDGDKCIKWMIGSYDKRDYSLRVYLMSNGDLSYYYDVVMPARHISSVDEIKSQKLFDSCDCHAALNIAISGLKRELERIKNPPKVQTSTKKGFFSKFFG